MLPGVEVLSCLAEIGVDAWGEKGLGLPDKLPAWPVLVGAGEAEKIKDRFKNNHYKAIFTGTKWLLNLHKKGKDFCFIISTLLYLHCKLQLSL